MTRWAQRYAEAAESDSEHLDAAYEELDRLHEENRKLIKDMKIILFHLERGGIENAKRVAVRNIPQRKGERDA